MTEELKVLHVLPPGFPDNAAVAWGEDRYGIWMESEFNGVIQRFRWIAPGEFVMGSPPEDMERDIDETPHNVVFSKGFWLGDTACTQELWQAVMGDNPSHFRGPQLPVERVTWNDCKLFLECANRSNINAVLTLPTEAQWEFACRAGTTSKFHFGDKITPESVNYNGHLKTTVHVKSMSPNEWGLYQMHGNVSEWCSDWRGAYPLSIVTDPRGASSGDTRIYRGGSWRHGAKECRSAYRGCSKEIERTSFFGFRVCRQTPEVPLLQFGFMQS